MHHRGLFIIRFVGFLLLVGVLIAVGGLAFRAGQAQGYALGLTVSGEGLSVPQAGAPRSIPAGVPGYGYWGWPHFGLFPAPFLGLLCLFGLGLAFLFALGAIFRPRHWHGYGRPGNPGEPNPDDWHGHWHGWYDGPPPGSRPSVKEKETPPAASNMPEPPAASAAEAD